MLKSAKILPMKAHTVKKLPIIIMLLFLLLFACTSNSKDKKGAVKSVPVTIGKVTTRDVPLIITAVGNVDASATVQIKSQVNGQVAEIHFKDGQYVTKGSLLFVIDPSPFQNNLRFAEAALAKTTSQLEQAKRDEERYSLLLKEGFVTQAQYDQSATNLRMLKASLEADKAAVENARLQLSYCYIYAPISGRIGSIITDKGNVVKAVDDKAMAVINQVTPVYVNFSVPEQYLGDIRERMAKGRVKVNTTTSEDKRSYEGILTFVDNTVDKTTGTIRLRADFDNKDMRLWPGQFVKVSINLSILRSVLVAPTEAVQTGQKGEFVYRLSNDKTVEAITVTTDISREGYTVVKTSALKDGDTVVTEGHMRIKPGIKVEVQEKEKASKS